MKVNVKVTFKNPPVQIYEKHWLRPKRALRRKRLTAVFWTDAEIETLIKLYNSGATSREISEELDRRSITAINMKINKILHDQVLLNNQTK